ncbi:MAG: ABC transporter substrate-binding protein [Pseudomonadota bacterium]
MMLPVWLLVGCSGAEDVPDVDTSGTALQEVVLQTDWYAQPEHGGFYQAMLSGLYEQAGLAVEIRPGANMTNVPQMVATRRIDFAVGTTDNIFMATSRGAPLLVLFPYFQHDPQCVMFHVSNGLETLADLQGRLLMIAPGAAYVQYLRKALQIEPQLIPLDYGLARFLANPELVQQCFLTSEPYYVAQQNVEADYLRLSSSGFDPYRVVYTHRDMLQEKPELVRAFTQASLQGWADYMVGDGALVHPVLGQRNPQQTAEFAAFSKQAMQDNELVYGSAADGEALGHFDRERLLLHLQHLRQIDLLDSEVPLDDMVAFELQEFVLAAPGVP